MKTLASTNKAKVLDLLTERLSFERSGVKLYDKIVEGVRSSNGGVFAKMLDSLIEHRNEEKEHEEWLEEQIRALGGDAHGSTEKSRLVETESKGIEEVILGGQASVPQMLHALLAAELVDNAGWDLLVEIADEAGDHDAKKAFKKRLHEEEDHLIFARRAVEKLAIGEVLGESASMPSSP